MAISPADAARCILDTPRTLRFLAGIAEAIGVLRPRFPGETLEVLYAGCGPFAALALPFLEPEDLRWTCVDVHAASVERLRRLLEHPVVAGARVRVEQADAATVDGGPWHLILTETLQRALSKEPQLTLTARLAPRLREGGVFLPESIRLLATLADLAREFSSADGGAEPMDEPMRIELGELMELTPATASQRLECSKDGTIDLGTTTVPELDSALEVLVRTEIRIHGRHSLGDHESGLTVPRVCHEIGRVRGGETLRWRYRLGDCPGIEAERVAS